MSKKEPSTIKLASGEEVRKDDARCEACGTVDELVSILGFCRATAEMETTQDAVLKLQKDLFLVGAEVAYQCDKGSVPCRRVSQQDVKDLVGLQVNFENFLSRCEVGGPPVGFAIPGGRDGKHPGGSSAAIIDYARTVARRCERRASSLVLEEESQALSWLNQVSKLLWVLARVEESCGAGTLELAELNGSHHRERA